MTALNKQALREKIKNKREFFDTQTIIDVDVLEALLDENHRLAVERDALRENIGGDNTRAAADIYFQLVEECEIPPGGSLVGYIDDLKERLSGAEKQTSALFKENARLKSGIAGLVHLGIRHGDIEVMSIAGDAQLSTPCTDSIIEKIAAGIGVKGE